MAATPSPRDRPRHPGAVRAWLIWWALLAALWLALVDTVVVPELVTGAVAAAIAATGAVVVRGRRRVLLRPRAAWARAALGPLRRTVTDLGPLAVALWRAGPRRDERGALAEVPYTGGRRRPARRGAPRLHRGARLARGEHARGRHRGRPADACSSTQLGAHRRPRGAREAAARPVNGWLVGGGGARGGARAARGRLRAPARAGGPRRARGGRRRRGARAAADLAGHRAPAVRGPGARLAVVSFVGAIAYLRFVEAFREE